MRQRLGVPDIALAMFPKEELQNICTGAKRNISNDTFPPDLTYLNGIEDLSIDCVQTLFRPDSKPELVDILCNVVKHNTTLRVLRMKGTGPLPARCGTKY